MEILPSDSDDVVSRTDFDPQSRNLSDVVARAGVKPFLMAKIDNNRPDVPAEKQGIDSPAALQSHVHRRTFPIAMGLPNGGTIILG